MQRRFKAILSVVFVLLPVLAIFLLFWADVQAENDPPPWAEGKLTIPLAETVDGMPLYPGDEKWEPVINTPQDQIFGYLQDTALLGTDLYASGCFSEVGGKVIYHLARWNGTAWYAVGDNINGCVRHMAAGNNTLFIAGDFTQIGYIPASNLASWNGSAWHAIMPGPSAISAMAVRGSELIVAAPVYDEHTQKTILSAWNGSSWRSIGSTDIGGSVNALLVRGTDLYIGGTFTSVNGLAAKGVARWDGSKWYALGAGVNGNVMALAAVGDKIYAGGSLDEISNLKYWSVSQWYPVSLNGVDRVSSLASIGEDLFIGGHFYGGFQTADQVANGVMRWDGSKLWNLGSGLLAGTASGSVSKLLAQGDRLYVSGMFNAAGNQPAYELAVWHTIPEVTLNYTSGAPGSTFLLKGSYFVPGSQLNLMINEQSLALPGQAAPAVEEETALVALTGLTLDNKGNIAINAATNPRAAPGKYQVTLEGSADAKDPSSIYTLAPDKPVRPAQTGLGIPVIPVAVPVTLKPDAFYHFYMPGAIK